MKKIFILFVAFFVCTGCIKFDSLSQDMIVTDIKYESIRQGKCLYTVRFFNRNTNTCISTMSFYGKEGQYSPGDTLIFVKLNKEINYDIIKKSKKD